MNRLSNEDSYYFANLLAKKLALDLDANDYSSLSVIADLLMELPIEVALSATTYQIGLERSVCHGLDEDGNPFQKLLIWFNRNV